MKIQLSTFNLRAVLFLKWPLITLICLLGFREFAGGDVSTFIQFIRADIDSTTKGVIFHSTVSLSNKYGDASYLILYDYEVAGVTYTSRIVNYRGMDVDVSATVKKYPAGKVVTVHYDASNPSLSVLEVTNLGFGVVFILLFCLAISFLVLIWNIPTKRKSWGKPSGR